MTIIAVAGKGGVGKTTLSSLMALHLATVEPPVLAIDADPNSNLGEKLGMDAGLDLSGALSSLREVPEGVAKHDVMAVKAREALVEGEGVDLIGMGMPQGPGCYCFANSVLRDVLSMMSESYRHVVIDNEAGMEHISRGTVSGVDALLVVSDPGMAGLRAASRIMGLADDLGIDATRKILVVSSVTDDMRPALRERLASMGMKDYAFVPFENGIRSLNMDGMPLSGLEQSAAYKAVARLCDRIILSVP